MRKRKSGSPSFPDLLLAFRKAKRANASERGCVGLLELARFEMRLARNLHRLRRAVQEDRWFDSISIGSLMVIPRSNSRQAFDRREVVRIGTSTAPQADTLEVRLQLEPSPAFTTVEVLYLWEFGAALEGLLDQSCLAYRLKGVLADGRMDREGPYVYEHWFTSFKRLRDEPIKVADGALRDGRRIVVTNTDVTSFFDSLDPLFLVDENFISMVATAARDQGRGFDVNRYVVATHSLLRRFAEFREMRRLVAGADVETTVGVPIGALTSRVFANVALASVDRHIQSLPGVLLYRRYVDDMVIVSQPADGDAPASRTAALASVFPGFVHSEDQSFFRVPATDAVFELNESKTLVHDLYGGPGREFLGAVQQSFSVVTSETRAFFGNLDRLGSEIEEVDLFGDGAGPADVIPRLRNADRFTLRRALATEVVRTLERCALLVTRTEATELLERRTSRMLSAIDGVAGLDDFEFALGLLRVALICESSAVSEKLSDWLERRTGPGALEHVHTFVWRRQVLNRKSTIRRLTRYLRRRIEEVMATSCSLTRPRMSVERPRDIAAGRLLRHADLRHLDREYDLRAFGMLPVPPQTAIKEYSDTRSAATDLIEPALIEIERFVRRSIELKEAIWAGVPAVALFLSIRPPSYADVSRRFLDSAEYEDIPEDVGRIIDACVDAFRGTRYRRRIEPAVALTKGEGKLKLRVGAVMAVDRVRVVLANLPVPQGAFEAAAKGQPLWTVDRLKDLDLALRNAGRAASLAKKKGISSILLLPELSIPRWWVRDLCDHAAQQRLGIVAGLEYQATPGGLVNTAIGVFPDRRQAAGVISWTKRHPARIEGLALGKLGKRLAVVRRPAHTPLIVDSNYGRLSVLICSEMLEAAALSALVGAVELLLVPAWNHDTFAFEDMGRAAAALLVHAFVCVANTAEASDSRVLAPIKEPRWEREWCRLVHRGENQIVWGDLPVGELRSLHSGILPSPTAEGLKVGDRLYRPLPPGL